MEQSYERSWALASKVDGPLSPHIGAFISSLIEQRYSAWCVRRKTYRAVDFDRWLSRKRVALAGINERQVARYHQDRERECGRRCPWCNELRSLRELLCFLREQGAIPRPPACADVAPADEVAAQFEVYLRQELGLAAQTIVYYAMFARQFLRGRFDQGPFKLSELRAVDVVEFVRRQVIRKRPRALKLVVTALRSFLRFAQYRGDVGPELIAAVPAVAGWATTPALPRAIAAEHAQRVLAQCITDSAVGRRDHAVLLLLARLGLRCAEVVRLMLEDVDWDAGRLRVRGKGGRECFLPLPQDVGEAIAAYLQHGRPVDADRHLFLRARAPVRGLDEGSDAVGSIVKRALVRSGVDAPHKGAHQFRHALAVQMLQRGASLPEIGELLRHRSPQTTSIYAKVDLCTLRTLALPWPGEAA